MCVCVCVHVLSQYYPVRGIYICLHSHLPHLEMHYILKWVSVFSLGLGLGLGLGFGLGLDHG